MATEDHCKKDIISNTHIDRRWRAKRAFRGHKSPYKIIAYFLRHAISSFEWMRQAASNAIIYNDFGPDIHPFQIHYSVDFRNSTQIRFAARCRIQPRTILNGRSDLRQYGIDFGPETYLKENCYFDAYGGYIEIGGQCAFAQNTIIHGGGGVKIGRNVICGANCYIISSNHAFKSRELPIMLQGSSQKGISIGNNVWIGGNVTILDGVNVGDNCVIGAGTTVVKSVPSNTLLFNAITPVQRKALDD